MRWHPSRRYPACCACSSSCRCFIRRNEFNFCSAHSKGRFDADPSEGCKVQKCIPQFQQRRCKPGFQSNAAPEGRNQDILQRVPRGPQIIICNVQPLCQHLKCIRVSQCSFRNPGFFISREGIYQDELSIFKKLSVFTASGIFAQDI